MGKSNAVVATVVLAMVGINATSINESDKVAMQTAMQDMGIDMQSVSATSLFITKAKEL